MDYAMNAQQAAPQPPQDDAAAQAAYAQAYWQHQAAEQQQQQQWYAAGGGQQQQWQQAGGGAAAQQQQWPQPPPPAADTATHAAADPGAAAYAAAYGQAYGGYGQWQQQQPQQQYAGYGAHATYPGAAQQPWGWHQQAQPQQQAQHGAWQHQPQQPSGYDYRQQAAAWSGAAPAPPPTGAPPPPQPPQYPAGSGYAAAPTHSLPTDTGNTSQQQQYAGSYTSASSYTSVPPPASLTSSSHVPGGGGRRPFTIRPQVPKPKPPESSSPLVAAFNQAAAKIGSSSTAPAYTRVQVGTASQQQQTAAAPVGPQQWPPALKAYVERAFKGCDLRQRPKLQEVLKHLIGHAQTSGELWTRDWGAMPLPDLSQSAADAAAVLAEVAAISGPATAPGAAVPAHTTRAWPSPTAGSAAVSQQYAQQYAPQQRKQQAQQQAQQQRRLDTRNGRKGRKRSYRDSDESSRSESEEEHWSRAERQRRQRRAGRFGDAQNDSGKSSAAWKAEERRRQLLAILEEGDDADVDWDALAIKGRCQELEKSYFRLTSAPDPATVRPEPVLRRALERLISLLREKKAPYFYALDQFKGMRQDCTVQHIRNDLTVQVYEAHGRAALEYGDWAEFNQCQSQLRVLYNEGVPGSRCEYLAYRLLYQSVHAKHGELLQLLNTLKKVTLQEAADPQVAHALAVRAALAAADYARFFRLYSTAPGLSRAVMDIVVPTLRFGALRVFTKAFLPTLPVPFLAALLGFVAPAPHSSNAHAASPASSGDAAHAAGAGKLVSVGDAASSIQGEGLVAAAAGDATAAEADGSAILPGCIKARFEGEHVAKVDFVQGCQDCLDFVLECGATVLNADTAEAALCDCKASAGQLTMPVAKERVPHEDSLLSVENFLKQAVTS